MRPDDVVRRLFLIALTFVIYVLQACARSERIKGLPFILIFIPFIPVSHLKNFSTNFI